jgi:hypothetical protein
MIGKEMRKMKQNYLLVYHNKTSDKIIYKYFETIEDMKNFITVNISNKKYWEILHKFEVKEI